MAESDEDNTLANESDDWPNKTRRELGGGLAVDGVVSTAGEGEGEGEGNGVRCEDDDTVEVEDATEDDRVDVMEEDVDD